MRDLFTKSLVAARALEAGHILSEADVALKKPGDGLGADRLGDVLGRALRRALDVDERIDESDLD